MIEYIVAMFKENDPQPKVVQELVRCKDCEKSIEPCNGWDRRCELIGVVTDDFYCGWGKRKEG